MIRHLADIAPITTSHGVGQKRVLLSSNESGCSLTQIAVTELKAGEIAAAHVHPDMQEGFYVLDGELKVQVFSRGFAWLDTGTHDSLSEASTFVEVIEKRQGLKVACLEAIAYRKGWISEERMRELAEPMKKNQYGQYLLQVVEEKKQAVDADTFRIIK